MKKLTLFLVFWIAAIVTTASADIIDAPHNGTNGIVCSDCHTYSVWWQFSPTSQSPAPHSHTDIVDSICTRCHRDGGSALSVNSHSSQGMGNMHRTELGDWSTACTDCHDPHIQAQLYWLGTEDADLLLVTGTIVASSLHAVLNPDGSGTTTFQYTSIVAKDGWSDTALWSAKTGIGRGMILVVSRENGENTFEITNVDAGTSEITVQGIINGSFDGANFGITYGQLIKSNINSVDIKFFDPKNGDFVDTANNHGLCQVCHTQTNHFKKDDADPASDHQSAIDGNNKVGAEANCIMCHMHNRGFGPGSDSGQHKSHLAGGMLCTSCHAQGIPDPLTSTLCDACHQDGAGGSPNATDYRANWDNEAYKLSCDGCHNGRAFIDTLVMATNGHERLVGEGWIRNYPCTYCHNHTVNSDGTLTDYHVNGQVDVAIDPQWSIVGQSAPSYDPSTEVCSNTYCHSDGTAITPEMRAYAWTGGHRACNSCHGHSPEEAGTCNSCHADGRVLTPDQEWMSAMPMYTNGGAGTDRANSHMRHLFTGYSCDQCHDLTVVGGCLDCHGSTVPSGIMTETQHINGAYHVNRQKNVSFKGGGSYNPATKTCSNTACHTGGTDPVWGDSVGGAVICFGCHLTTNADQDDFGGFNGIRAQINIAQWQTTGHGRPTAAGNYPKTGNPPANFPANGCWYCHDNKVLHRDASNPYRLKKHQSYSARFDKECVYCHMLGQDTECLGCHNDSESLSPQLADITTPEDHTSFVDGQTSCVTVCHPDDDSRHKTGAGLWTLEEKIDVRNSYVMMGVCLVCHDDDSGGQCTTCHATPPDDPATPDVDESLKYAKGYDPGLPGTGRITAISKASSVHFGHKHYSAYETDGIWKGGKFCWDCHDPHGDSNIHMIQDQVATQTEGTFGQPITRAEVVFTDSATGLDYAKSSAPYNGICNVCHSATAGQHYNSEGGDSHNAGRKCTMCHEHRFTDSHASGQNCDTCHGNKPVPRHSAFGQPRECLKCHAGTIGKRMDIVGQFNANSHHVQGVELTNKHCYACHWEATELGLINTDHHEGYNNKTDVSIKNAKVDLVIWKAGQRPTVYDNDGLNNDDTAITFLPSDMAVSLAAERQQISNVTQHCLGCHSDQNNNTDVFNDCRVPRQYAWDGSSIAARYKDIGTTTWGKYTGTAAAAKKNIVKAFSGHGNAVNNGGGWSTTTGVDGAIPNTRAGSYNVECFDCHSSHGSKVSGISSSYTTFNGTHNGANLKETQAGKGGYAVTYKATANLNPAAVNFYNAGAGQCFDCHETENKTGTPWGYSQTFGATAPIVGYKDNLRFSGTNPQTQSTYAYRSGRSTLGGHLHASSDLTNPAMGTINGLCAACHDPHGVTPTLGADMANAVPMLKGTWLTSPYLEDRPNTRKGSRGYRKGDFWWKTDRNTFNNGTINETEEQFAGLCLQCHPKDNLTDGINKNTAFRSLDRVHETVKGWGNNAEHRFPCSKCHQPHASGLPRLMQTNCLNYTHRNNVVSGGTYGSRNSNRYPRSNNTSWSCHESGAAGGGSWSQQLWNNVTPW